MHFWVRALDLNPRDCWQTYFLLYFWSVCVCVYVAMCAFSTWAQCPQRNEEDFRSTTAGGIGTCEPLALAENWNWVTVENSLTQWNGTASPSPQTSTFEDFGYNNWWITLSSLFLCCSDRAVWPKVTWGRKGLFQLQT